MTVKQFSPDPDRLAAYGRKHIGDGGEFIVKNLKPMFGGASRFTYRFDYSGQRHGEQVEASAILRCIPPDGGVSPADARKEYKVLTAVYNKGYPVPEPIAYCSNLDALGCEFLIMEEIKGCDATLEALMEEPYVSQRESIGKDCWTLLGTLATYDPVELGLVAEDKALAYASGWLKMLESQEKIFRASSVYVDPITEAVFGWLRHNPPPPPQKPAICHGDFRSGNFLYAADGRIKSILDWEIWSIGDPLCDLAFSLLPLWADEDGRVGRLLKREDAITLWEQASGLKADPDALRWWEVYCCQRFMATNHNIYKRFLTGSAIDGQIPLAMLGWGPRVEKYALELITRNSPQTRTLPATEKLDMSSASFQNTVAKVLAGPLKEQVADSSWWSMQCEKLAAITRYSVAESRTSTAYKADELEAMQGIFTLALQAFGDNHPLSNPLKETLGRPQDFAFLRNINGALDDARRLIVAIHKVVFESPQQLPALDKQLWDLYALTASQKLSLVP
ncbi:MAG: phosphotransferase family protein [Porticoccaceae bacterium]|nr:phosphotransferase family protein [Porticoccaceae bacterium]